ncbi:hypothetical protein Pmar_PMAR027090 [Perkinsus marinus ATCC 50983]|uniref:Uncharacterized protein n=1 Tax=Perkinsus marinus (strain ATCC 50983 / TXsc) TaxID=423536 RepID=C5L250_PERM5|nr:hypothetical protein Pmar_PMAR027090 [Perkinsus marinus ATCC 50983]EER09193.1 hypothetical protein Pmar_PMAR027090 [Perkinsus marinus ATCC 50983]|eukprot:XP_002777377.1 hypothetical protein Pmar_PMAR027090 [Perkinsus marinus ATCC 50983]
MGGLELQRKTDELDAPGFPTGGFVNACPFELAMVQHKKVVLEPKEIEQFAQDMEGLRNKLKESENDKYKARAELREAKEMKLAAMNKARKMKSEMAKVHEKNEELFKCCKALYQQLGELNTPFALEADTERSTMRRVALSPNTERTYTITDACRPEPTARSVARAGRGSEASTSCPPTSREMLLESQLKRVTQKLEEMKRTALIVLRSRSLIEEYLHEGGKRTSRGRRHEVQRSIVPSPGSHEEEATEHGTETFLTGGVEQGYSDDEKNEDERLNERPREVPALSLEGINRSALYDVDELAKALDKARLGEGVVDIDIGQLTWDAKEHILRMLFQRINNDPMASINKQGRARLRAQLVSVGIPPT